MDLQRFGLPQPIIRLISLYLFYSKSDDPISELLEYNKTKIVTQNIVFYYIINFPTTTNMKMDMNESNYVEQYPFDILCGLLNTYYSDMQQDLKYVLRYIMQSIKPEIMKQSYMYRYMDLNMLDAIVIQACIKNNKLFLDDLLDVEKIRNTKDCRCDINGRRKKFANGEEVMPQDSVSTRDVIEFFALEDDVESLDFALNYFVYVGIGKIEFVWSTCLGYIENNNLPKLAKYREEYLRVNG